jgi:hypothetical protein
VIRTVTRPQEQGFLNAKPYLILPASMAKIQSLFCLVFQFI